MQAIFKESTLFKKILESLKELVTDVNFDCQTSSINFQSMDISHVALIEMCLYETGFETYYCSESCSIGLKLESLYRIIKSSNTNDKIILTVPNNNRQLQISLKSDNGKNTDYSLKLLDIDNERLSIPPQDYKCIFSLNSMEFQRICKDVANVSAESVSLECNSEGIKFMALGEDGNVVVSINKNNAKLISIIKLDDTVYLNLSLKYLQNFAKSASLSENVTISMSTGVPILFEFNIEETLSLKFFLAPTFDAE